MGGHSYNEEEKQKGGYVFEDGFKGKELETKIDLESGADIFFSNKLKNLCPKGYKVENILHKRGAIHSVYCWRDEKSGKRSYAFEIMEDSRGAVLKIKGEAEKDEYSSVVILERDEQIIRSIGVDLASYIALVSQGAMLQNSVIEYVGQFKKEKMSMGLFSENTERLFVVTPSVCTIPNTEKSLHQIEIEYAGIKENTSTRVVLYKELANVTRGVFNKLPHVKGLAELVKPTKIDGITKFDWIVQNVIK